MTQYNRHVVAPLNTIIDAIKASWDLPGPKMTYEGWTFNIHSLRLKTFCRARNKNQLFCSACNLPATFFAVESFVRNGDNNSCHVNLYGVNKDGKEVLFTHDHTLARSLGGRDNLGNTTMMCSPCNSKKSLWENDEVKRRKKYKKEKQNAHDKIHLSSPSW